MGDLLDQTAPKLPGFHKLYDKLLHADLETQLPGNALTDPIVISIDEVRQLVGFASILSTYLDPSHQSLSYEIATRLIELQGGECLPLVAAADIIYCHV